MAFAGAKFIDSLLSALNGTAALVECAFVASEQTDASYFSTPLELGVCINQDNVGLAFIFALICY